MIRELLYADDVALVAHSHQELQDILDNFATTCREFGMTITIRKTVVMGLNTSLPLLITVHNITLDTVLKFCYLGSTMSATNSLTDKLDTRIAKAATVVSRLQKSVWENNNLSVPLKVRVYEACVVSTLLYGAESWPTFTHQEKWLDTFHMRNLQTILGIKWQDDVPNTEVLNTTKCLDLWSQLQKRRLCWAGQVTYG